MKPPPDMQKILDAVTAQIKTSLPDIAPGSFEVRPIVFSGNYGPSHKRNKPLYGFEVFCSDATYDGQIKQLFSPLENNPNVISPNRGRRFALSERLARPLVAYVSHSVDDMEGALAELAQRKSGRPAPAGGPVRSR